jgi:zinc/manganese transport system permease protein
MFAAGFMINAWISATIVAIVAGVIGHFVVWRGSAFPAHAIPKGAFAGAAAASLLGISTLIGLGVFSLLGALGIGTLGRRGRHDVVTALTLVMMLALGAAFLSRTTEYEPEIYSLLFGEILGVSASQILPTALLGAVCLIAMTVPVTGALLVFSLMIGPPAAARSLTPRPILAMALSVVIALITAWVAIAASYFYNWPIGFFVGTLSALAYGTSRAFAAWRRSRATRPRPSLNAAY